MSKLNLRVQIIFPILVFVSILNNDAVAVRHTFTDDKPDYRVTFSTPEPNYLPGSTLRVGITFKNLSSRTIAISQDLMVLDTIGAKVWKTVINLELELNQSVTIPLMVPVPKSQGRFKLTAGQNIVGRGETNLSFEFLVVQPVKSDRLSKIMVHTPDSEVFLNTFLKTWSIKAPTISWGQVLLLGKKSWASYAGGDREMAQLIDRALKREMSVIFIDFGSNAVDSLGNLPKYGLPFNVTVSLTKASSPEQKFEIKPVNKELIHNLTNTTIDKLNGYYGVSVPATDMKFEGKNVKINALVTTGTNPFRFPVVELVPATEKGKVYLCQLLTDGRLDESVKPQRNHSELPAYDPVAVQFLLNLISASVGDNLLK